MVSAPSTVNPKQPAPAHPRAPSDRGVLRHWPVAVKIAVVFGGLLLCGVLVAGGLIAYLQQVERDAAASLQVHDAQLAQAASVGR